jgi:hypothetical protein
MSKKYHIITPQGESRPFQYGELSIMFQKGQLKLGDLCREDGTPEAKRLDVLFPNWTEQAAASRGVEEESARRSIKEGGRQLLIGAVMIAVPAAMFVFDRIGTLHIAIFLVGLGMLSRGVAQKRRGTLALARLGWDENRLPDMPQVAKRDELHSK